MARNVPGRPAPMGDDTPGKITASRSGRTGSVSVSAIDCSFEVPSAPASRLLVPAATVTSRRNGEKIPLPAYPFGRRRGQAGEGRSMTREEAWQLVGDNVQAAGLRRHMLSVEA